MPVRDTVAVRGAACHCSDRQVGHKRDGGQRLAAEAQRCDALQVLEVAQLGGCVALAQQRQVVLLRDIWATLREFGWDACRCHAPWSYVEQAWHLNTMSVVLDLQQLVTALLYQDVHLRGPYASARSQHLV